MHGTPEHIAKTVTFAPAKIAAEPVLRQALNMLAGDDGAMDYKNADVLMISDFIMGNLSTNLVTAIETEKEKSTDFYSLVIGASDNLIGNFDQEYPQHIE